jgi:hypothetical protein
LKILHMAAGRTMPYAAMIRATASEHLNLFVL